MSNTSNKKRLRALFAYLASQNNANPAEKQRRSISLRITLSKETSHNALFRRNTALLMKNFYLHINYMLRKNFPFAPCLA
jgi:hypothetical protein